MINLRSVFAASFPLVLTSLLACTSATESPEEATSENVDELQASRRGACPRGSVNGYVSCAAGFTAEVVSRVPHCETCVATPNVSWRCRLAGLTPERCRELYNESLDNGVDLAKRCRAAGLTIEQCRRLVNDDPDDTSSPIRGDLDGNGIVDETDVRILKSQWGATGRNRADINGDGIVDGLDLRIVYAHFGDYR